jgi:hypothetical protein
MIDADKIAAAILATKCVQANATVDTYLLAYYELLGKIGKHHREKSER